MADANWGPQDATAMPTKPCELPLFTSRSMLAFYIDLFGPLHWLSKRQSVMACSSAEAEIYATNSFTNTRTRALTTTPKYPTLKVYCQVTPSFFPCFRGQLHK
jgi:hypothetical protein